VDNKLFISPARVKLTKFRQSNAKGKRKKGDNLHFLSKKYSEHAFKLAKIGLNQLCVNFCYLTAGNNALFSTIKAFFARLKAGILKS